MKNIFLIAFVLVGYTGIGQKVLNEYKYIIIPKRLAEFKEENKYLTSTLLKHQFVKRGFTAVYDDALPEDLNANRCFGLTALLQDNSFLFSTKAKIVLENCNGQEVFSSKEAINKIKEYKEAYKALIIDTMLSFDGLNYSYKENPASEKPITLNFKNDVKSVGDNTKKTAGITDISSKNTNTVVEQTSSLENQSYKSMEPVTSDIKQAIPRSSIETKSSVTMGEEVLYAQVIQNGYQLIDRGPKVIMKLLNSSTENVFIGQADGKSGMVFQKDGIWIFEYYAGSELVQEKLTIKF